MTVANPARCSADGRASVAVLNTACQCIRCSIIDILGHDERDSGIVYVGPAINGWKPVVGPRCDAFGERRADVQATLERLSVQYGEAHAFYFGAQGDGSAWLVVQDGVTVRRYSSVDLDQCAGEPLSFEQDWILSDHTEPPPRVSDRRASIAQGYRRVTCRVGRRLDGGQGTDPRGTTHWAVKAG